MLTGENSSSKRKTSAWASLSASDPKCVSVRLNQGPLWIDCDHQPKPMHAFLFKLTVLYHTICSSTKWMLFRRKLNLCIGFASQPYSDWSTYLNHSCFNCLFWALRYKCWEKLYRHVMCSCVSLETLFRSLDVW